MEKMKAKKKKALSRDYLIRAAYSYLQRFATTEKNLRDVLDRKVRRRMGPGGESEGWEELYREALVWIDEIVQKAVDQNLVNDRTYAEAKSASLNRSGNSRLHIAQKLLAKGIAPDVIEEVLQNMAEGCDKDEFDHNAAVKYVRKRRFGGFSLRHDGTAVLDKELASLCRAGFSYSLAVRVLKMTRLELEEVIYRAGS